MTLADLLLLLAAGFASGAINAVAGGGTFIAFGALTLTGFAPIAANATSSVAQFPEKMGSLGIETAVAAARGQAVQPSIDTGTEMVTKENAASFA